MFGLGFWELVTILFVAVIFLKPDDIPAFLRNFGRLYGRLTEMYRGLIRATQEAEDEVRRPVRVTPRKESAEQGKPLEQDYRSNGHESGPGSGERIREHQVKEELP